MSEYLAPGATFEGKYRIDAPLGEGGFGVVYRAQDLDVGRPVAVKLLKPDDGQHYHPKTVARFRREAAAVGALRSQFSARLFDYGESQDGWLFMVFEWVDGDTLSQRLDADGQIPPSDVERVLRQVLSVLAEAHGVGLLHRDIKPDNIVLCEDVDGRPSLKLLDFGLAKPTGRNAPALTEPGIVLGTPRYMSPEQLMDSALTAASDIYCLGLVAFEMLLGEAALSGSSIADQLARLQADFTFDFPGSDALGRGLVAVIRRMTARDPAARFARAEDVLHALDELDAAQTRSVRVVASASPGASKTAESSGLAGMLGVAVGLAFVVAAVLLFVTLGGREPEVAPRVLPAASSTHPTPIRARNPPADAQQTSPRAAGCGKALSAGMQTLRWSVGLDTYEVLAYVPESYPSSEPSPVVAVFHSSGGETAQDVLTEVDMFELAERTGTVLVAPAVRNSTALTLRGRRASARPWRVKESKRAAELLATLDAAVCLDPDRFYAVGVRKGAEAVRALGCDRELALTGVVEFAYRPQGPEQLCRDYQTPTLVLTPGDDPSMPIDGKPTSCNAKPPLSLVDHERDLHLRHRCGADETAKLAVAGGTCSVASCEVPLTTCLIDGGQDLPKRPGAADECRGVSSLDLSTVVWDFFQSIRSHQDSATTTGPECGKEQQRGRTKLRWTSGLQAHELEAYVPKSYDPNVQSPLLILFHEGEGQDASGILDDMALENLAERERLLVVAPQGESSRVVTFRSGVVGRSKPWTTQARAAAMDTLANLGTQLCTDPNRIFALGYGDGMRGAEDAACELGVRAVVHDSQRRGPLSTKPTCVSAAPTLLFIPTADARLPEPGLDEARITTVDAHEALYRREHQCDGILDEQIHPGGRCVRWNCSSPLTSCRIDGGPYWQSFRPSLPVRGPRSKFPHAKVMWAFFASVAETSSSAP